MSSRTAAAMSGRFPLLGPLLCFMAALALIAPARAMDTGAANPLAGDSAAAAKGEELFGRNCQQCHNSRGKGGKGPQLVRGAWGPGGANSDNYMYGIIAGGRPGTQMGAFSLSLSQEEIWQIVTFLRAEAKRVAAAQKNKKEEDDLWY
jgi:mono/diheme cytochrome c family protein